MKPWLRQTLFDRLILIKHMPQVLHRRRNDATPSRRTNDVIQRTILLVLDNRRRDRRKRSFTRFDKVGRRGRVAESVRLAGDGEVVHFVVHDDAGGGDDDLVGCRRED